MPFLWLLVVLLILFAVVGGLTLSHLLFWILVIALIILLVGLFTGRAR